MAKGESNPPGSDDTGDAHTSFSEVLFEALRQRSDIFEDLIAYVPLSFNGSVAVRHGELPEEAAGEEGSGNFFSGFSARIELGRGFTLDNEKSHAPVVVLSYDYWTRSFARDPDILGMTRRVGFGHCLVRKMKRNARCEAQIILGIVTGVWQG
jgi:hypothetical protein